MTAFILHYILSYVTSRFAKRKFHWLRNNISLAVARPRLKKLALESLCKNYRKWVIYPSSLNWWRKRFSNQFMLHCQKFQLIPIYQSVYRLHYSCENVVLKLGNDNLRGMEYQNVTACVFMDEKFYGISGTALNWYKSHLQPREFRVCVNSNYSKSKSWTFPVPQGSGSEDNRFITYCPSSQSVIPQGSSE